MKNQEIFTLVFQHRFKVGCILHAGGDSLMEVLRVEWGILKRILTFLTFGRYKGTYKHTLTIVGGKED